MSTQNHGLPVLPTVGIVANGFFVILFGKSVPPLPQGETTDLGCIIRSLTGY